MKMVAGPLLTPAGGLVGEAALIRGDTLLSFDPFDIESAGWVIAASGLDVGPANSYFYGQKATELENLGTLGSRSCYNGAFTLSGSMRCETWLENVDAPNTVFALYDATVAGFAGRQNLTWSGLSLTNGPQPEGGTPTVSVESLTTSGPNGGELIRLTMDASPNNAGNSGRLYIYPTVPSPVTAGTIIIHGARVTNL